jgi:hypothetical protein
MDGLGLYRCLAFGCAVVLTRGICHPPQGQPFWFPLYCEGHRALERRRVPITERPIERPRADQLSLLLGTEG